MGLADSINGVFDTLNNGNWWDLFSTGIFAKIFLFLKVAAYLAITVIGGGLLYQYYFKYKDVVYIHKQIGVGATEIKKDYAKIETDDQGKTKHVLMKTRRTKKVPCTSEIPPSRYKTREGKRNAYHYWLDDNWQLHPIMPPMITEDNKFDHRFLKIEPQDRVAWSNREDEELKKRLEKKSRWDEFKPYAALMMICLTTFLILFFVSKSLGEALQDVAASIVQMSTACTK